MTENMKWVDDILKLYGIYSNDLKKYNTIIWQFPTALVTVNVLAIHYLIDKPHALVFIPVVNFVLIHALFKHVHHQRAIIEALKKIEDEMRKYYGPGIIPNFEVNTTVSQTKLARCFLPAKLTNWILEKKSAHLLSCSLLILNIVFFFYTTIYTIQSFIDC